MGVHIGMEARANIARRMVLGVNALLLRATGRIEMPHSKPWGSNATFWKASSCAAIYPTSKEEHHVQG